MSITMKRNALGLPVEPNPFYAISYTHLTS